MATPRREGHAARSGPLLPPLAAAAPRRASAVRALVAGLRPPDGDDPGWVRAVTVRGTDLLFRVGGDDDARTLRFVDHGEHWILSATLHELPRDLDVHAAAAVEDAVADAHAARALDRWVWQPDGDGLVWSTWCPHADDATRTAELVRRAAVVAVAACRDMRRRLEAGGVPLPPP